jgi:tetratricopeptide (TPR) repeat protein
VSQPQGAPAARGPESSQPTRAPYLEATCRRFDQAWQSGNPPDVNEYLSDWAEPQRTLVLQELIRLEVHHRKRQGTCPQPEEYRLRFPELDPDWLREVLTTNQVLLRTTVAAPEPISSPFAELPALDRHEVLEEMGRGGMGVIYRGRDPDVGRELAIKVLVEDPDQRRDLAQRFLEEAQITGQLQHPGVVPIHALGRLPDGRPCFTMKLVVGQTLEQLLDQRTTPAQNQAHLLMVFEQVCQTLAYAHARNVIHRDIKPSNVMVGAFAEVQLMDWGLAKVIDPGDGQPAEAEPGEESRIASARSHTEIALSRTGAILGTPAYMAPEQAQGKTQELDERCDVFGLGALLCEILTGEPPYGTDADVPWRAGHADVSRGLERLERCGGDPELLALARQCLAPEPRDRPRHAGVVAERITAYRTRVSERLRQVELEKAQAQVKASEERKRRLWQVGLAASLGALVLVLAAAWTWHLDAQARHQAHRNEIEARALDLCRHAEALRKHAWEHHDQPTSWKTSLVEAKQAIDQASTLVQSEQIQGAPQQRVAAMASALEADVKDLQLWEHLQEIRAEAAQRNIPQHRFRWDAGFVELLTALEAWGLSPARVSPEQAATTLGKRPPGGRERVVEVLDECLVRAVKRGSKEAPWFLEVLRRCDANPTHNAIRQAVLASDHEKLLTLAGKLAIQEHRTPFIDLVARAVFEHDPDEASALLRRARAVCPHDFWINHDLAWCLYLTVPERGTPPRPTPEEKAKLDEAIRCYSSAQALKPEMRFVPMGLAFALLARGDTQAARAIVQGELDRDPTSLPVRLILGEIFQAEGRHAQGLAEYRKAETALKQQEQPRKWLIAWTDRRLACALHENGQVQEALTLCQQALEQDPDYALAQDNLGRILGTLGRWDEAVACSRQALQHLPWDSSLQANLGHRLLHAGQLDKAEQTLRTALNRDPHLSRAYADLGQVLLAQQRVQEAEEVLRRGVTHSPTKVDSPLALARLLWNEGRLEEALPFFRQAAAAAPASPEAQQARASACQTLWLWEEASAGYNKLVKSNSSNPQVSLALGETLLAQGKYEQVQQLWQQAQGDAAFQVATVQQAIAQQLAECERYLALERRLPALLAGTEQVAEARDLLCVADLCHLRLENPVAAVRFYEKGLKADLDRKGDQLARTQFQAACTALAAAANSPADKEGEAARASFRKQALAWLQAAWTQVQRGQEEARLARATMQARCRLEAGLAGVRAPFALANLPAEERHAWEKFWREVAPPD